MVECKDTLGRTIPAYQMVGHKSNRMTALGIDNKGKLILSYGIEDYDKDGQNYYYNAAENGLWLQVRDQMYTRLASVYSNAESAGLFNTDNLINKFYDYQKTRPEALMIEDAKGKYDDPITNITPQGIRAADTSFMVSMELGEKIDQRRLFLTYQTKYFSSKYSAFKSINDNLVLNAHSGNNFQNLFTIMPYSDIYLEALIDTQSAAKVRAKHDVAQQIQLMKDGQPYGGPDGEVALKFNSFSTYKTMSSLSNVYTNQYQGTAPKLQNILIGSSDPTYRGWESSTGTGWSVSPSVAPLCKEIDFQGQYGMNGALDMSENYLLEKLNIKNTKITSVTFASGSPVNTIRLGNYVSDIRAKNLAKITQVEMASYSNIATMRIENCTGTAINTAIQSIMTGSANSGTLARFRLTNVNLHFDDCSIFKPLLGGEVVWRGYDAQGAEIDNAVMTGTVHFGVIGTSEEQALKNYFGDGLTITYDEHPTGESIHRVRYYNDGQTPGTDTPLYYEYIRDGRSIASDPAGSKFPIPTKTPTVQYNYVYSGWLLNDVPVVFPLVITEQKDLIAKYTLVLRSYDIYFKWIDSTNDFPFNGEKVHTKAEGETSITVQLKGNNITPQNPMVIMNTEGAVLTSCNPVTGECVINIADVLSGADIIVSYRAKPVYTINAEYGSTVFYDTYQYGIPYKQNYLCAGFKKDPSSEIETPSASFVVDQSLVELYDRTVQSVFDQIAVPETQRKLSAMSWAQVVAICNAGKISSTDPTIWVTETEGVETAWFYLQKRGFIQDEDTKTVVCYNGDTYKIQPVGYLQDRYTEDQGVNYKPIPVTFGTVNLANIEMVYKQSISEPFGWKGSAIRTYLNGSDTNNDGNFLVTREGENGTESHVWRSSSNGQTVNEDAPYISNLPMDLQQAIQICCKQNMIPSPDTFTWDSITYDKLFVPSALEVGDPGTIQIFARNFVDRDPEAYPGALEENRQLPKITYSIFGSAGTTGQSSRQKYKYGTSTLTGWWTRHSSYQGEAANVISGGQMIGQEGTYYKYIYFIKDYRSVQSFPIYFCMGTPKET